MLAAAARPKAPVAAANDTCRAVVPGELCSRTCPQTMCAPKDTALTIHAAKRYAITAFAGRDLPGERGRDNARHNVHDAEEHNSAHKVSGHSISRHSTVGTSPFIREP